MNANLKPLAISMGDPMGIGPEICMKALASNMLSGCIILGDSERLRLAGERCGLDSTTIESESVRQIGYSNFGNEFGFIDAKSGKASFSYLCHGIEGVLSGAYSGLVTAPIHKEAWSKAGIHYPGHTEVLAEKAGGLDVSMMLANDDIRTVLVTIHVPLRQVCDMLTPELELKAIRQSAEACQALGIKNPRIAVCGLNPHAGEGGLFGSEDLEVIVPAINIAKAEGLEVSGPWPGDTIFSRARQGEFDVVVAQYHDQGLIPVKYMGIADGVNITIGLPFVRTSPDHGTAFDIAGTGKADPSSLLTAVSYARKLIAHKPEFRS